MAEQYVPKPGTGSAFKNENKTEDWHGDYQGKLVMPEGVVPGATYYFNIYKNTAKNGNPYLGISIGKAVQAKAESAMAVEADMPF